MGAAPIERYELNVSSLSVLARDIVARDREDRVADHKLLFPSYCDVRRRHLQWPVNVDSRHSPRRLNCANSGHKPRLRKGQIGPSLPFPVGTRYGRNAHLSGASFEKQADWS